MGITESCSYYGSLDESKPIRSLAQDLAEDTDIMITEEMRHMEDRLKRHITECKREVIKEVQLLFVALNYVPKKETKNVK